MPTWWEAMMKRWRKTADLTCPKCGRFTRHYCGASGVLIKGLRGKNIACWCPLHEPCHGEVILRLANKAR